MQGRDDDDDDAADEEEPETLPLLARRVMAGRQSIVPQSAKVLGRLESSLGHGHRITHVTVAAAEQSLELCMYHTAVYYSWALHIVHHCTSAQSVVN